MMEKSKDIIVSIIIPTLNEEKYIGECLESLINQSYSSKATEILIIDGCSIDNTINICKTYTEQANIRILKNEKKKTTYALNKGIKEAQGKYIIRIDAHAYYAQDYVEKCVYYLDNLDVENVGGIAETKGKGKTGEAIAKMLSSKFGVGDSAFRTQGQSGYVDTVPFGAFRKEVFDKIGGFNHNLPRSEDNDINARIRDIGGKIWLADDIKFVYYCRDTIKGILKMSIQNGNALFRTMKENHKAMSVRHFIPFCFFISLIVLPLGSLICPIARILLGFELLLYLILDAYFSFKRINKGSRVMLMWLFPLFHLTYGFGSFLGLIGVKLY